MTVGANLHSLLALPVNSAVIITLSSLKQVLPEVKCSFTAWFGLLLPHSLLDTKRVLAALGEMDNTKEAGTDPSHWEFICSELSDVFERPNAPLERAVKHKIDLPLDSVAPAKR